MQLRRRDERDGADAIDGRVKLVEPLELSISPTIATISLCQMLAFLAFALTPSLYVMATVSNVCYLGAGLLRAVLSLTRGHSSSFILGQLAGASFCYVFLGSSSFAFHAKSVLNSPAHSFDILGGWLLVLHGFFVCFTVCLIALAKRCLIGSRDSGMVVAIQIMLSMVLIGSFTLLMTFYDTIYNFQLEYYVTFGPGAAIFGAICRFMLVYVNGDLQWRAVGIASVELGVVLTLIFAAILCQGEMLSLTDRKLAYNVEGDAYDLYHAHWHYFLALATAILYSRAADAAQVVLGTHHRVCVCVQSWLDMAGLTILFFYAVVAVGLKEGRVETRTSLLVLFFFNAVLLAHAMLTGMDWMMRRRHMAR